MSESYKLTSYDSAQHLAGARQHGVMGIDLIKTIVYIIYVGCSIINNYIQLLVQAFQYIQKGTEEQGVHLIF